MRLGKWEWLILWCCINNGGSAELSYIKEVFTGYSSLDSKKMEVETYRPLMMKHKGLTRAAGNLEVKGLVINERENQGFGSKAPQIKVIYLTKLGFKESKNWALGHTNPIPIVTEHSPLEISVYDESGLCGTYERTE